MRVMYPRYIQCGGKLNDKPRQVLQVQSTMRLFSQAGVGRNHIFLIIFKTYSSCVEQLLRL